MLREIGADKVLDITAESEKELQRITMERDILKKAITFFVEVPIGYRVHRGTRSISSPSEL